MEEKNKKKKKKKDNNLIPSLFFSYSWVLYAHIDRYTAPAFLYRVVHADVVCVWVPREAE